METPLLDGIRKCAAGIAGLTDDAARLLTRSSGLSGIPQFRMGFQRGGQRMMEALQPHVLTGVRGFVGRHPLMTLGAGGLGGYVLANKMGHGKAYQQGSEDMMRQMGPYAAAMNAPQGAMSMPAWARPPARRM